MWRKHKRSTESPWPRNWQGRESKPLFLQAGQGSRIIVLPLQRLLRTSRGGTGKVPDMELTPTVDRICCWTKLTWFKQREDGDWCPVLSVLHMMISHWIILSSPWLQFWLLVYVSIPSVPSRMKWPNGCHCHFPILKDIGSLRSSQSKHMCTLKLTTKTALGVSGA